MNSRDETADPRLMSDSAFWQAATIGVAVGLAVEVALWSMLISAITSSDSEADPAPRLIGLAAILVMVLPTVVLFRKRTPRARGAAVGLVASLLLFGFGWLATV